MGLIDAIRGSFSFLGSKSGNEERMAHYVIREHHRGRPLEEILTDKYVVNRCTREQIQRLLDRPELVHAIGDDLLAEAKQQI